MAASPPKTLSFAVGDPVDPARLPALCRRLGALLEGSEGAIVVCDVDAGVAADAVAVDALARLQLTARRLGCRLRLRHASQDLHELLAFTGLADVVAQPRLRLEPVGQAEEREQRLGVEEEAERHDPAL